MRNNREPVCHGNGCNLGIPLADHPVFTNENIEVEYQRTDVLGMEFETTLSGLGIRDEPYANSPVFCPPATPHFLTKFIMYC